PALSLERLAASDADLALYVLRADLSSAAPLMDSGADLTAEDGAGAPVRFVINQIDRRRPLCRDVETTLSDALGEKLIACIGYDEAAPESFARGTLTANAAPNARLIGEIETLSGQLRAILRSDASDTDGYAQKVAATA
ncbi:MAG: hypothetical protein AAGL49_02425, partial [Pseudomonadota bacterium]